MASWVKDGMLEASLANSSFLVMSSKLADTCLYLVIISLNILPLNNSSRFFGDDIVNNGLVETLAEAAGE